jgi:hypothetical protein
MKNKIEIKDYYINLQKKKHYYIEAVIEIACNKDVAKYTYANKTYSKDVKVVEIYNDLNIEQKAKIIELIHDLKYRLYIDYNSYSINNGKEVYDVWHNTLNVFLNKCPQLNNDYNSSGWINEQDIKMKIELKKMDEEKAERLLLDHNNVEYATKLLNNWGIDIMTDPYYLAVIMAKNNQSKTMA